MPHLSAPIQQVAGPPETFSGFQLQVKPKREEPVAFEALNGDGGPGPAMQVVSQTPRLKANDRRSPILAATMRTEGKKASSLLGGGFEQIAFSQHNFFGGDDSPPMDHETSMLQDEWNIDLGNEPATAKLLDTHNSPRARVDPLGAEPQEPLFPDHAPNAYLELNEAPALRHRSLTFHHQHMPIDFEGLLDVPRADDDLLKGMNRRPARLSFDYDHDNEEQIDF